MPGSRLRRKKVEPLVDGLLNFSLENQLKIGFAISVTDWRMMPAELPLPDSAVELAEHLLALRNRRRVENAKQREQPIPRKALRAEERATILSKTAGRCHICGGPVDTKWQADHVLAHSGGGGHSADNYLPAHSLCNNYRWDYLPQEFQWAIKIGVWARKQMENSTGLGPAMLQAFFQYETRRIKRQKK
jgi:5-methylcytosine-specific restriction endonuclease McrA